MLYEDPLGFEFFSKLPFSSQYLNAIKFFVSRSCKISLLAKLERISNKGYIELPSRLGDNLK